MRLKKEEAPLLDDYIFKRTFTREGTKEILKDFLEAILDEKIFDLNVRNSEIPKEILNEKASILDIRAEFNNGNIVDIEMQVHDTQNIKERSTVYMSKNIATQVKKAEDYQNLTKSIVIFILNFNLYNRNSYHQVAHMKFEKAKESEYVYMGYDKEEEIANKNLEMHFIELPKFIKKNPGVEGKLEQWLWLICGKEEKVKMAEEKNDEIKKAVDLVEEMLADPEIRELYDARMMARFNYVTSMANAKRSGLEEGKKEGKEEGIKEERNKIARELKSLNMPEEDICRITGLTKEELKNV